MNYTKHILSNGLIILLDKMPQIESISAKILFKVGSINEKDTIQGISHIVEHMNFKGTHNRTAKDIATDFDKIGGHLNAYTSKERTVYYSKTLKGDIGIALDVLSDIVLNSTFPDQELHKEKNVIKQEISDSEDEPSDVLFDALWQKTFEGHQIAQSIAGSHKSVDSCTRDNILSFVAQHYTPTNAIIGISGNFNEEEVLKIINEKFANWSAPITSKEVIQAPQYVGGDIRINKPIEQAHIAIAFNGVSIHDDRYYIQQIAALIAGGSMSSRLFQEVREKRGLAYNISTFSSNYGICGLWGVYASTDPASLNELTSVTILELKKMTNSITQDEITIAKAQVKSSLLMTMESSGSRSEKLVSNMATFDRIISNEEIVENINKVTIEDIQNCIIDFLSDRKRITIAAVGQIDNLLPYEQIVEMLTQDA